MNSVLLIRVFYYSGHCSGFSFNAFYKFVFSTLYKYSQCPPPPPPPHTHTLCLGSIGIYQHFRIEYPFYYYGSQR